MKITIYQPYNISIVGIRYQHEIKAKKITDVIQIWILICFHGITMVWLVIHTISLCFSFLLKNIVLRKTLIYIKIIQGSVSDIITYYLIQEKYCGYLFALNMTSIWIYDLKRIHKLDKIFVHLAINILYVIFIFCCTAVFGWFYQALNNLCDTLSFLGKTIFTINNSKDTSNF